MQFLNVHYIDNGNPPGYIVGEVDVEGYGKLSLRDCLHPSTLAQLRSEVTIFAEKKLKEMIKTLETSIEKPPRI